MSNNTITAPTTTTTPIDTSVISNRFRTYFSCFGSTVFASALSQLPFLDETYASSLAVNALSDREILECASHHGNIGAPKKELVTDAKAQAEQGKISDSSAKDQEIMRQLRELGEQYKTKHGIKFMVSAKGKSGPELLEILKSRMDRPTSDEWYAARRAMFDIFMKRISSDPSIASTDAVIAHSLMEKLFAKYPDANDCASVAATWGNAGNIIQEVHYSDYNDNNTDEKTKTASSSAAARELPNGEKIFHFGSASKIVATTFCLEYFLRNGIDVDTTKVNTILKQISSTLQLFEDTTTPANDITIADLLSDSALDLRRPILALKSSSQFLPSGSPLTNGHLLQDLIYVKPKSQRKTGGFIVPDGAAGVINNCAGLLVAQHIIQLHHPDNEPLSQLTSTFLGQVAATSTATVASTPPLYYPGEDADDDDEEAVESLAHGLRGTLSAYQHFLLQLAHAFNNVRGNTQKGGGISHDTARRVLFGFNNKNYSFLNTSISDGGAFILDSVSDNKFLVVIGNDNNLSKLKFLSMQCFQGADCGKGFTLVSPSDTFNVAFASQGCCVALGLRGFDFYGAENNKFEKLQPQQQSQREFYRDEFLCFFERQTKQNNKQHGPRSIKLSDSYYSPPEEVAARFTQLAVGAEFNAASLEYGAKFIPNTNEHESSSSSSHAMIELHRRVLSPLPPQSTQDGFYLDSAVLSIYKQQHHNCEEFRIALHHPVQIHRIEFDFSFYNNNNHNEARASDDDDDAPFVEVIGVLPLRSHQQQQEGNNNNTRVLVPKTSVKYYYGTSKVFLIADSTLNHLSFEELIIRSYPCGSGFNRIKAFAKRNFF